MSDQVIQFEGTIYENGYGLLAQKVMRDKKLPRQSKLIYAYMCSFAGISKNGERTAFPSVDLQCSELGMTDTTYYKWRKHLIDSGYIKITKQRKEHSKFDRNLYSIIAVPPTEIEISVQPVEKESEPYPKNCGMDRTPSNQDSEPYPNSSRMVKPRMDNSGTNSNSFNSNNKDLDTTDTEPDLLKNVQDLKILKDGKERQRKKDEYMSKAFYENDEYIPKELGEMLSVFSRTTEQAKKYYQVILTAKKKVETQFNKSIWLNAEHELTHEIINSFSRAINKIEKDGKDMTNTQGYLYKSIYDVIAKEISARDRFNNMNETTKLFSDIMKDIEN